MTLKKLPNGEYARPTGRQRKVSYKLGKCAAEEIAQKNLCIMNTIRVCNGMEWGVFGCLFLMQNENRREENIQLSSKDLRAEPTMYHIHVNNVAYLIDSYQD